MLLYGGNVAWVRRRPSPLNRRSVQAASGLGALYAQGFDATLGRSLRTKFA